MRGFRGFTLVEILVSVVILSFLIAGIFRVLNIGRMTYSTDLGLLDLDQNAHRSMEWMVRESRESSVGDINIVSIGGSDDKITFDTPNETGIQYYRDLNDINGDNIVEQIIREYPAGTWRILANNISSLQLSLNNRLLEIQLTANKVVSGRDLSLAVKANAHLRNE